QAAAVWRGRVSGGLEGGFENIFDLRNTIHEEFFDGMRESDRSVGRRKWIEKALFQEYNK
ncbi:MAG: hypothetical protein ABJI00_06085, partial [Paracoccaceae bacterium]